MISFRDARDRVNSVLTVLVVAERVTERAGDADECKLDVIPTAVTFWQRLGFVEVEAQGEQAYLMAKGGDRPMVKRFVR